MSVHVEGRGTFGSIGGRRQLYLHDDHWSPAARVHARLKKAPNGELSEEFLMWISHFRTGIRELERLGLADGYGSLAARPTGGRGFVRLTPRGMAL